METTYGHQVTGNDDKFIGIGERAAKATAKAGRFVVPGFSCFCHGITTICYSSAGSMLVDFLPFSEQQ